MPTTPTADAPSGQPKAATIYDVARLAGVSHQTVSRLLKGENTLSPRTRRRVEKALAELDYRPNEAARTLATRRSQRRLPRAGGARGERVSPGRTGGRPCQPTSAR
ncbi:MAG: LacI family DNA-binding transcriptional regulator [Micropruina sp.]|nr:LacI family DNA-binding transcriptional regulator [Micropruina sp.]